MLCNRTSLGERQQLLSLVALCFLLCLKQDLQDLWDFQDCGTCDESHDYKLFVRLGVFLIGRFSSYKSFFISLAAECFDFGDGMLDGCVARWGVRNVDRATGGKLGDEPPIVWGPRLPMDDDRCPADAYIGNEVRR